MARTDPWYFGKVDNYQIYDNNSNKIICIDELCSQSTNIPTGGTCIPFNELKNTNEKGIKNGMGCYLSNDKNNRTDGGKLWTGIMGVPSEQLWVANITPEDTNKPFENMKTICELISDLKEDFSWGNPLDVSYFKKELDADLFKCRVLPKDSSTDGSPVNNNVRPGFKCSSMDGSPTNKYCCIDNTAYTRLPYGGNSGEQFVFKLPSVNGVGTVGENINIIQGHKYDPLNDCTVNQICCITDKSVGKDNILNDFTSTGNYSTSMQKWYNTTLGTSEKGGTTQDPLAKKIIHRWGYCPGNGPGIAKDEVCGNCREIFNSDITTARCWDTDWNITDCKNSPELIKCVNKQCGGSPPFGNDDEPVIIKSRDNYFCGKDSYVATNNCNNYTNGNTVNVPIQCPSGDDVECDSGQKCWDLGSEVGDKFWSKLSSEAKYCGTTRDDAQKCSTACRDEAVQCPGGYPNSWCYDINLNNNGTGKCNTQPPTPAVPTPAVPTPAVPTPAVPTGSMYPCNFLKTGGPVCEVDANGWASASECASICH